ncbi:PIN domain-containing protein [Acanthopleuribacter pedis]|uniref:DUF4411 family protein n=1 Tax=Acanthopleuribacter pedis TaxID=442870 RepID=A0A8J7QAA3_9BACT|nr:PIN domain-containing protein [Acanthopleuribacter pedis]MBO1317066.1 DUF4411 family protein [Acanthopleuribacter pedis]
MYIFDSNSFNEMSKIYPSRFPSFWTKIDEYIKNGSIISVKEAYEEVTRGADQDDFLDWVKNNKAIFLAPSQQETFFVVEIFETKNFRDMVRKKQLFEGKPVADPFLIASAKVREGIVVTEERYRKNSAKIPTICEHFGIKTLNLEGFMTQENWLF